MPGAVKFPYLRLEKLFEELRDTVLPQDELARRLSVSTRTIRNDIDIINSILADHGARFILQRNKGYHLETDDVSIFEGTNQQEIFNKYIPRSASERIMYLLVTFLTSSYSLNLQSLADKWGCSRAALQTDLADVRQKLSDYGLVIEIRPRHGMKLVGAETAIRLCLTDILRSISRINSDHPILAYDIVLADALEITRSKISQVLSTATLRLTDEGLQFLTLYCAVAAKRIVENFPIESFSVGEMGEEINRAAQTIGEFLSTLTSRKLSVAEIAFLKANIAGRATAQTLPDDINGDDAKDLAHFILAYINKHYSYDLRHDEQLLQDLVTHIRPMITRVRYQIDLPNPVLDDIKQNYALAYDMTLLAISNWSKHSSYTISENEMGFLVLHIGVGLERHYQIGYVRYPRALLVCDSGNATLRNLEALIQRHFPQVEIRNSMNCQDYNHLDVVKEDFVIANTKVENKNAPVVVISNFPTSFQIEQLAKLAKIDRTRPYILDQYFSEKHFLVADKTMTRDKLFAYICGQLAQEGYVDERFLSSVQEREAIVSTMLGDGIALPHALGLFAQKTTIYTVLAPHGIEWGGGEIARLIFLIAISKAEYEKVLSIYDIFISILRDRAAAILAQCKDFQCFKKNALSVLVPDIS
ncbi:BglG family transcription antiterminator [Bartonella sp. HY761]|uniref:BglG family transcription antiterminator n=1 Tax=Bartonella sp. HY761 TaxID=2979330 RepID=UPI0021E2C2E5|nr:BglG family transcription antiterminator [Bartonella sp. HY761]UXN08131.1 BglG family transcription antiterminator [Bartonella sp. HY761]